MKGWDQGIQKAGPTKKNGLILKKLVQKIRLQFFHTRFIAYFPYNVLCIFVRYSIDERDEVSKP